MHHRMTDYHPFLTIRFNDPNSLSNPYHWLNQQD